MKYGTEGRDFNIEELKRLRRKIANGLWSAGNIKPTKRKPFDGRESSESRNQ